MAERVAWVPNRWRKYMDGNVWKFSQYEFNALPRYTPLIDPLTGAPIGWCQIIWSMGDDVYVVFYNRDTDPDKGDPRLYEQPPK